MSTWSRFNKIAIFVIGAAGGAGAAGATSAFKSKDEISSAKVFVPGTAELSPGALWNDNWDFRQPKCLVKPLKQTASNSSQNAYNAKVENHKSKVDRHIILVRHGQYNVDGQDDKERILTPLGKTQAHFSGERLKELNLPWDKVISSTLTRAQETASIIRKSLPSDLPFEECPFLCEGAPIPPQPPVGHWRPPAQFFQEGARIEAAFRKYFHRADPTQEKDSYTLIVCHANVIRYIVCRALQLPPEAWLRLSLNHASLTWIKITPSGYVSLRTYGDSGHIPPESLSSR